MTQLPPSLVQREELEPATVQGTPPKRVNNLSSCVPGILVFTLTVFRPSVHLAPVFYPRQGGRVLKIQTLGTWYGMDLHYFLRGRVLVYVIDGSLSQKCSRTKVQEGGFWSKVQQRAGIQVSHTQQVSLHLG